MPSMLRPSSRGRNFSPAGWSAGTVLRPAGFRGRGSAQARLGAACARLNPFRVSLPTTQARSPAALDHLSRTHPELVRRYGDQLWLDPGEPAAREHVLSVILDVVKRYDVNGITFDDYFYPYPEKDAAGRTVNFPDDASWRKYGAASGMAREEWRRANVNQFIENTCHSIHALKPWVKFGISPFGIWRPGFPKQIQGLDAYAKIYADSRLWLASGWLDYLSPQLYWPVDQQEQSFPAPSAMVVCKTPNIAIFGRA